MSQTPNRSRSPKERDPSGDPYEPLRPAYAKCKPGLALASSCLKHAASGGAGSERGCCSCNPRFVASQLPVEPNRPQQDCSEVTSTSRSKASSGSPTSTGCEHRTAIKT